MYVLVFNVTTLLKSYSFELLYANDYEIKNLFPRNDKL